ncbi:hypothetical protein SBA6_840013 [Candidatus Sulfopaludibacter sp. SbA6]|nr:hypothetical protein SBA6_840013 [Candidatus Sulfopaludibacter sp. SbA6]
MWYSRWPAAPRASVPATECAASNRLFAWARNGRGPGRIDIFGDLGLKMVSGGIAFGLRLILPALRSRLFFAHAPTPDGVIVSSRSAES